MLLVHKGNPGDTNWKGIVVLAQSENEGVIVFGRVGINPETHYSIGKSLNDADFTNSYWQPLDGEVVLKN